MIVWAILKHLLPLEMKVLRQCWGMCLCSKLCRTSLCLFMSCFVQLQAEYRGPALPLSGYNLSLKPILGSLLLLHATQTRGGVSPRPDMNSQDAQKMAILVQCAHLSPGCPVRSVSVSCTALPSSSTTAYQLWWDRPGVNISQLCNVIPPPEGWSVN